MQPRTGPCDPGQGRRKVGGAPALRTVPARVHRRAHPDSVRRAREAVVCACTGPRHQNNGACQVPEASGIVNQQPRFNLKLPRYRRVAISASPRALGPHHGSSWPVGTYPLSASVLPPVGGPRGNLKQRIEPLLGRWTGSAA